jgi:hypothetical protein
LRRKNPIEYNRVILLREGRLKAEEINRKAEEKKAERERKRGK